MTGKITLYFVSVYLQSHRLAILTFPHFENQAIS